MNDLNCPYCNAELEVCHDDGEGYEENVLYQRECSECKKNFVYQTFISFSYEPEKADCLNNGSHIWEPTFTYPVECTVMRCSTCGERRTPTHKEMENIKRGREK